MSVIDSSSFAFRDSRSDKVYHVSLVQVENGYVVNYSHGKRDGHQQSGTKTKTPVSLDKARKVYEEVRQSRLQHPTTPYTETTLKGASPVEVCPPATEAAAPARRNGGLQLFTELDSIEAGVRVIRDPNYAAELKFDGKRILMEVGSRVTTYNRTGGYCGILSEISSSAKRLSQSLGGRFTLDGEWVGNYFYAFDLLELGGTDCKPLPYLKRKKALRDLLTSEPGRAAKSIRLAPAALTEADKFALCQWTHERMLEGLVLKRIDSPYEAGRRKDQFKLKFTTDNSFVVLSFNERNSVTVGCYDDKGNIVECGSVTIRNRIIKPVVGGVLDVKYLHAFSDSNRIYQPRMLRTRDDIQPEDCKLNLLRFKGALPDEIPSYN